MTKAAELAKMGEVLTNSQIGGRRNMVINGAMQVAQRGTGAFTTSNDFPIDRFQITNITDGAFSAQQDSSAPPEFENSIKFTTTTADSSLSSTQFCVFVQSIEGYNMAHFGFGASSAKTVTLSFWVRSSLTGTFGGVLKNDAGNRSHPYTYTIDSADTWEYKTVTITGDTTGTWLKTNGRGAYLQWGLGVGSTYSGTAGSWAATNYISATGATSVIGTLNATWQLTGVQLEVGEQATPFEHRSFGEELALCQRYFYRYPIIDQNTQGITVHQYNSTGAYGGIRFKQTMRVAPTFAVGNATSFTVFSGGSGRAATSIASDGMSQEGGSFGFTTASGATVGDAGAVNGTGSAHFTFDSEL